MDPQSPPEEVKDLHHRSRQDANAPNARPVDEVIVIEPSAAQRGDDLPGESTGERSFVQQFLATEPALRSFIFSQVPNWADMNEILQQTSLVLWQKFSEFEEGSSFRSWAFKVARFEVLNYVRKQSRSKLVFSEALLGMLAADDTEFEERLEEQRHALTVCLQELTTDHRRLVEDFYGQERSTRQLALIYKKTTMAIYQTVHRLRVTLLKCVEKVMEEKESQSFA